MPGPAPSGRASTKWKMFSVVSPRSPPEMNRFTPPMCHVPSGWATAFARPAPTSEPASGSVSTMVADQPRSKPFAAQRTCCSLPSTASECAIAGPRAHQNAADGFALNSNSLIAHVSGAGAATPPTSSARPMRHHSASLTACTDFANSGGTEMVCLCGSNTGGLRSASANDSATGPSASLATSSSMVRTVSLSRSP